MLVMAKVTGEDTPPPGPGLYTVTCAVPADAIFAAEIDACSPVTSPPDETMGVVGWFVPFQRTTEAWLNVLPLTVSVNAAVPAEAAVELRDVMVGTGAFSEKLVGVPAVLPLALTTCTDHVAGSLPNTAEICKRVLLRNEAGSVTFTPTVCKRICMPDTKPLPLIVNV